MTLSHIKKNKYLYLYLLVIVFLLLKMARGVYGDYSSKGGFWNIIQMLFIIIGMFFFFSKCGLSNKVVNRLLFFSFWIMFVSILNISSHPIFSLASWFYFFMILCAPMVLLIFYCLGLENDILDCSLLIKATFYVLIAMFYFSMTNYRIVGDSDEFMAFSDIYYPLCLLPLVLFQTKPQRAFIPLLAIMVGIIVSGKRGGLIMVAIVAMFYYFIGNKRRVGNQLLMLVFFAGISVASLYFIKYIDANYDVNSINRIMEISEDGGSGRIWRWKKILSEIGMSSVWGILFGHGFDSIYGLIGGRAHNDFLEVFYNYGLFAVVFYIAFYIKLISVNIRQYKRKYPNAKYLTCSIIIAIVLAMVSYFAVEPSYVLSSMFVIGLQLGDWVKFSRNGYIIST